MIKISMIRVVLFIVTGFFCLSGCGSGDNKTVYEWKLVESTSDYDNDGIIEYRTKYSYSQYGNKSIEYYSDGEMDFKMSWEYDEKGNNVAMTMWDISEGDYFSLNNLFDEDNNLITSEDDIFCDGSIDVLTSYIYSNGVLNRMIREIEYPENTLIKIQRDYLYDDTANTEQVTETIIRNEKTFVFGSKKTYLGGDKEKILHEERSVYDSDTDATYSSEIVREYDDKGNLLVDDYLYKSIDDYMACQSIYDDSKIVLEFEGMSFYYYSPLFYPDLPSTTTYNYFYDNAGKLIKTNRNHHSECGGFVVWSNTDGSPACSKSHSNSDTFYNSNGSESKIEYDNDFDGIIDYYTIFEYKSGGEGNTIKITKDDHDGDGTFDWISYEHKDAYGNITRQAEDYDADGKMDSVTANIWEHLPFVK